MRKLMEAAEGRIDETSSLDGPWTEGQLEDFYHVNYTDNFEDLTVVKYNGYKSNGNHAYNVVAYDDNVDKFLVTQLYVYLDSDGKLAADFPGMPDSEYDDYDEALKAASY